MLGPTQNLGPIISGVLTSIEYKHPDRQAKYINRLGFQGASHPSSISILISGCIKKFREFSKFNDNRILL